MRSPTRSRALCAVGVLTWMVFSAPAVASSFEGTWEPRDPGPVRCKLAWPDGRREVVEHTREPLLLASDARIGELAENVSASFGGGSFAGGLTRQGRAGDRLTGGALQACSTDAGAAVMVLKRGRVFPENRAGISGTMLVEIRGFDVVQTICTIHLVRTDPTPPTIPGQRCPLG